MSRFSRLGALVRVTLARNCLVILAALTSQIRCTESIEVLTHEDAGMVWSVCEQALEKGSEGDRCAGFQACVSRSPDGCCSRVAECPAGRLDIQASCIDGCPGTCVDDSQCLPGREWCSEGKCTPCLVPPPGCFDNCPRAWLPRTRNGCHTCECVPPSECYEDSKCGTTGLVCYAGAWCQSGCTPGDPKCCEGNFCSAPGCTVKPPVGCMQAGCPRGSTCVIASCVPTYCRCESSTGTWRCTDDCGGGVCVPVQ